MQELRDALKKADVEDPTDLDHIKVAIQGYNYGMDRWISWIKSMVESIHWHLVKSIVRQ